MTILIKILQFVMSLSILVIVHEFGHFALAKFFKTKSRKILSLFRSMVFPFKYKRGETEYV